MLRKNLHLWMFALFSLGLPLWAMESNQFNQGRVHGCTGECYEAWKDETGGVVMLAAAQAEARASASPEELGKAAYAGCVACHGQQGEGGIGPALAGQTAEEIYAKLVQYKNGETRGNQSSLMWAQSSMLSDEDMQHIAAFVESL
ncbi:c-type cytochrome [Halioglobus sp. HI00S01]|uniref:c-type cytochrome n=1 Tax=Halioglobus sp. HI00S01 TaxID=1822214 RepID=UPI0026D5BCE4|nr:c-type cytochrome [Halioglobus sp. HI00S01]